MAKPLLLSLGNGKVQELVGGVNNYVPVWNASTSEWQAAPSPGGGGGGSGTVTSVTLNAGSTGLTISGASSQEITTSGTFTLAGTLAVGNGGTGATTLTQYGVLLGNGTSAVGATSAGSSGQVLVGQGSANPSFQTVSGDATFTNAGVVTVTGLQSKPVSNAVPTAGKVLTFDGTNWAPADAPQGGSGGSGIVYFFNKGTARSGGGLPAATYQLGRTAEAAQSSVALTNVVTSSWTRVGGFVTDALDPSALEIPAGLWDFNFWALTTAAANNQLRTRFTLYAYDGSTNPEAGTVLSQSDDIYLYDADVIAQYIASMLIPGGTTLPSTSTRLYLLIEARASTTNRDVTFYFGDSTPSHTHTTLPSVGGTGLVKTVNGVFQSPASLLVNADVSASAAIAVSKLAAGSAGQILTISSGVPTWAAPATSGTVTSVSTVDTGMGLTLTTANGTTTPVITLAGTLSSAKGGTGIDASSSTGVLTFLSGTAIVRTITDGDVSNTAAIARTKLASGTAYRVLANGASGAMSELASAGTANQVLTSGGASALPSFQSVPYDLAGEAVGALTVDQVVFHFIAPRALSLTALTQGTTASAVIKIQKNGSDVTLPGAVSVAAADLITAKVTTAGTDVWFTVTGVVA